MPDWMDYPLDVLSLVVRGGHIILSAGGDVVVSCCQGWVFLLGLDAKEGNDVDSTRDGA